jgi:uncharacterized protein (DUF1697 family)
MVRYIAFLRGINVGGHNQIKMDELKQMLGSLGFGGVKTYIQSGNVAFDFRESDKTDLARQIEQAIKNRFGHEVPVILRTQQEMEAIVRLDPFQDKVPNEIARWQIAFLPTHPEPLGEFPIWSTIKDVEIFQIFEGTAFCLGHPQKNGNFGFANAFIEKLFKMPATTRNWNTVVKMAEW